MKRIRDLVLFAIVISLGGLFLVSCGTSGGGGGTSYSVLGELNFMRMIAIVKNGSIDLSNFQMPITGEVVSTATVTVSNETTGSSVVLSFSSTYHWYSVPTAFVMNYGDQISVKIEIDGETITGGPTVVPNAVFSNLGPTAASRRRRGPRIVGARASGSCPRPDPPEPAGPD